LVGGKGALPLGDGLSVVSGEPWPYPFRLDTGQKFPEGTDAHSGTCQGLCHRRSLAVARARVGLNWRQAVEYTFCAECLADMILGAPAVGGHVYVGTTDGLYHEAKSGPAPPKVGHSGP
jgi:hypothetical protein